MQTRASCPYRTLVMVVAIVVVLLFSPPMPANADDLTDGQWYSGFLKLAAAQRLTTGTGVTVAVIDSGIDASHPDLKGRVVAGADFSAGGQVSTGDGLGDSDGHGTQMAGLIVGHGKVRGVAPGSVVISVRDRVKKIGSASRIAEAVRWATGSGADVISISSGVDDDPRLRDAIHDALTAGIVVVAAAGNSNVDSSVRYPAAYPGVVAACGVNRRGEHSAISVVGPELVLCAPSDNVSSTYPNSRYALGVGTSESTALIAGAAALVRARFPNLSGPEIVHRLTATAADAGGSGRDDVYGYGVVNIVDALTKDVPPLTASASSTGQAIKSTAAIGQPGGVEPWHVALGAVVCLLVLAAVGGASALFLAQYRRR
jgi:type VII secretion-associated serine protease mycosin